MCVRGLVLGLLRGSESRLEERNVSDCLLMIKMGCKCVIYMGCQAKMVGIPLLTSGILVIFTINNYI